MSETGSLDRMKSAAERRKKGALDTDVPTVSGRVEGTRPDTDTIIDELLKNTKLELSSDTGCECQNHAIRFFFYKYLFLFLATGLALFIARDGTTALGSHEVKPRMQTGVFKHVVMENPR